MESANVFKEDVEYLKAARDDLLNLDRMKKAMETLSLEDRRLQRLIGAEEKSISDEIAQTLKQRKDDISATYDKELENNQNKIKRMQEKRDRKKNRKITERVQEETAEIREENRLLTTEMATMFKQKHLPQFCNSSLYYVLFMAKSAGEWIQFLLWIIFCFFLLPGGICYLGSKTFLHENPNQRMWYAIIFMAVIVLIFLCYLTITNLTKVRNWETLQEGRKIREKIKANHKQIYAISNSIAKDKDESLYGLDDYDKKLALLEEEGGRIAEDKQNALTAFENDTKKFIVDEIVSRRNEALQMLKDQYHDVEEKYTALEEAVKEQNLILTNQYEKYLGKDFVQIAPLEDLIRIMEEGDADTVSSAIAFYKS